MSSGGSGGRGDGHDDGLPWFTQTRDNSRYDLNSKIMLSAIVSLSVVVLIVALLHIYARYVLRRQARRRAALHRLGLANALQLRVSGVPPKTGLDPLVLSALPVFAFERGGVEVPDEPASDTECAVCLSALEVGELTRLLPNCKHVFHAECIDRWFGSHTTCPVCRTEAEPRVQPTKGEVAASDDAPTAPPQEAETSENGVHPSAKVGGSSFRLSSFRRMLSRQRSSTRTGSRIRSEETVEDLERQ